MKTIFFLIISALLIHQLQAQSLSKPLGNLKSYKKTSNGVVVQTDHGNLKATVYSANIIKIDITEHAAFNDFSYAVTALPDAQVKILIQDQRDNITISTDSLNLVITKKPVRVSLYNKQGVLVNGDDEAFGTSWIDDQITTYKKIFPDEKFIGLGEKTGGLNRRGSGYQNWNSDVPGYETRQDPLYATIPFYIGIRDSVVYGIFLDNSSKTQFNFGASQDRFSSFSVDNGDMNYYLLWHSSVAKILESYSWLTGRMPLPPMWSLGYHQCRWSYFPESEMMSLAKNFRDRKIPCDGLWFDIHYMQDYKVFTWSHDRFPDPEGMLTQLDNMGFKNVVIIDPGIKVEKGYAPYEDGVKKDMFIKYSDGKEYNGQVWPGWCAFTDFTKPDARVWWGTLFKEDIDQGIDGFWCDMNEIASWGAKTPDNLVFNFEGHPVSHRTGKNVFGLEMSRATYEGTLQLFKNKRPFVLTRSGFAGLQRYTAIWTGDNLAKDDHMLLGVRLVNSLGLSGVPFAGVDVGGFVGDASSELMARWITIGAFCPFYRSHKEYNGKDAEPWAFGENTEEISRNYIQLRYNLLPYIYSAFYEASQTGMPVQRSLAINYSHDNMIYQTDYENEYFFGPSILVAPCVSTVRATKVYLPEGIWFDFYNNKKYDGNSEMWYEAPLEKLPLFIKAGSFIPEQSPVQFTAQQPTDTLTLHVYYSSFNSHYVYYEDAGDQFDYQKGDYYKREMQLIASSKQLVLAKVEGNYTSHFKNIRIILHGFEGVKSSVTVNGTFVNVLQKDVPFIASLAGITTIQSKEDTPLTKSVVLSVDNSNEPITIGW